MKWICVGGANVNPAVSDWARKRIGIEYGWERYNTLSLWEDGAILAAVIYEGYVGNNISMHVAAEEGKRWLNRAFLHKAFYYPFIELKVDRVTGLVPDSNETAKRFDEHLGFKREGTLRRGALNGGDLILYGMLREECRHLEMKRNGQTVRTAAA